ncbi:MAG: antibiotic biosynthesis monooxygenase [Candidatus Thermoplasmatota archaeon]|nr:antibiotic biosynthesis monooxygenase [Candidatus Thermoplasmatota archaeon]
MPTDGNVLFDLAFTVKPGNLDTFAQQIQAMAAQAEQQEPGTLTYEIRLDREGNRCLLHERYQDENAAVRHVQGRIVQQNLAELLEKAEITRFEVAGVQGDKAQAVLREYGATFLDDGGGFRRSA